MTSNWKAFHYALFNRGPIGAEADVKECLVPWSGNPLVTDEDRRAELCAAIVTAHHRIFGTWLPAHKLDWAMLHLAPGPEELGISVDPVPPPGRGDET